MTACANSRDELAALGEGGGVARAAGSACDRLKNSTAVPNTAALILIYSRLTSRPDHGSRRSFELLSQGPTPSIAPYEALSVAYHRFASQRCHVASPPVLPRFRCGVRIEPMSAVVDTVGVRRFKVDEYYRMANAGVIDPDERLELIEGVFTVGASPTESPRWTPQDRDPRGPRTFPRHASPLSRAPSGRGE